MHCLFMDIYNFYFLCFALNPFLNLVIACIVNFYQQTDQLTDKVIYRSSYSVLTKCWVHSCALTTLIFYVLLRIKLFIEFQQLQVIIVFTFCGPNWPLLGSGLGLKQLRVLLMYIYKFPFLYFAPNAFLYVVSVNVENFYRLTGRRTK